MRLFFGGAGDKLACALKHDHITIGAWENSKKNALQLFYWDVPQITELLWY